jgi:DNA-binding transcriptional regulator LsrR (DeoR family)
MPKCVTCGRELHPERALLALLYNEQRLRPDEIAAKLGLSPYLVTQIILAARNQGKL